LKELASEHHRGATLKVLTECSKFAITHRFFVQAWEAMNRKKSFQPRQYEIILKRRFGEAIFSHVQSEICPF
jgi:hypothetical protein